MRDNKNKKIVRNSIEIIKMFPKKTRIIMAFIVIVAFFTEAINIQMHLYASGKVIDLIQSNAQISEVYRWLIILCIFGFLSAFTIIILDYLVYRIEIKQNYYLKDKLYFNVLNNIKKENLAKVLKVYNNDCKNITSYIGSLYLLLATMGRNVGAVVLGLYINWQMSLMILVLTILVVYIQAKEVPKLRGLSSKIKRLEDSLLANLYDAMNNIIFWRIMSNRKHANRTRNKLYDEYVEKNLEESTLLGRIYTYTVGYSIIVALLVMIVGIIFIYLDIITIGKLVVFMGIQGSYGTFLRYCSEYLVGFANVHASANRYNDLFLSKESHKNENIMSLDSEFKIILENVYHKHTDEDIIKDFSYIFKPGEIYYITGANGAGKSTLLKIINNEYNLQKGKMCIDYNNEKILDVYNYVASVDHEGFIFKGSIAENISLSSEDIDEEKINYAIKAAELQTFVNKFPNKTNHVIGDGMDDISGGEIARLSLARAIYSDSPIILLDEVFSSLDIENVKKLRASLEMLAKNNKCIISVTHRLELIDFKNDNIKEIAF